MNLEEFNDTAIIKKLKKSKSNEKLNELTEKVENDNKLEEPIQKIIAEGRPNMLPMRNE